MYEMEGASSAPPHQGSQSPGQLALRATRQGQAPVRKSGFPVFSHLPELPPGWYPFPTVRYFYRFPERSARAFPG